MTKSDPKRLSICRLLTLLLVLVVVGTSCNQVNGASLRNSLHQLNWANLFNNSVASDPVGSTQVRKHLLLNHCSEYVQVKDLRRQGVDARGKHTSTMRFSTVIFKPRPRGTIVMQGEDSHYYICISRSGRPRTSAKLIPRDCEFREEYGPDKSKMYRLANRLANDNKTRIYLGFNKGGRPLKGTRFDNKKKQKCFRFTKLATNPAECTGPRGVNYCDIYLKHLTSNNKRTQKKKKARKIRHQRHHKKSRKHGR